MHGERLQFEVGAADSVPLSTSDQLSSMASEGICSIRAKGKLTRRLLKLCTAQSAWLGVPRFKITTSLRSPLSNSIGASGSIAARWLRSCIAACSRFKILLAGWSGSASWRSKRSA